MFFFFTITSIENDYGPIMPQTTSKADIHQKKIMLSVWRDWKGVVYFELLPRNQTIIPMFTVNNWTN